MHTNDCKNDSYDLYDLFVWDLLKNTLDVHTHRLNILLFIIVLK